MSKYVVIVIIAALLAASWYWLGGDTTGRDDISGREAVAQQTSVAPVAHEDALTAPGGPVPAPPQGVPSLGVTTSNAVTPPEPAPHGPSAPDHLQLWDDAFQPGTADHVSARTFQMDPHRLTQLRTGQRLSFVLTERGQPVVAEIRSTANPSADVQTWQGMVLEREPQDNLIIARGPLQTHITIFTDATTYSVVVDNATGQASLVDEGDLHEITVPYDDGIALPEVPDSLPPL